jgi:putative acetyltransferase
MNDITIREDDLTGPEVIALLEQHLSEMHDQSPACSVHALDLDALRAPGVTFWSAWDADRLAGCAALKELDRAHAEIKSMRTVSDVRGRGVGATVLRHLLDTARDRGCSRVSLETGSNEPFAAARRLYARHGFVECPPFGSYELDPWSTFMTIELDAAAP